MFLDNVTTVILIAPVTILICELLGFNPTPFLIAEDLLSDTGGITTLIGGSAGYVGYLYRHHNPLHSYLPILVKVRKTLSLTFFHNLFIIG